MKTDLVDYLCIPDLVRCSKSDNISYGLIIIFSITITDLIVKIPNEGDNNIFFLHGTTASECEYLKEKNSD